MNFKKLDQNIKCGVLESSRLYEPWKYVKSLGMEYYHPLNFTVTEKVAEKCAENDIGLNIWFGISDYDYSEYLDLKITGLITDFPDRVKEII